eukprot:1446755-Rhodomonas_salina.2
MRVEGGGRRKRKRKRRKRGGRGWGGRECTGIAPRVRAARQRLPTCACWQRTLGQYRTPPRERVGRYPAMISSSSTKCSRPRSSPQTW